MEITRLGIMGGTFNPIHLGHLMIAEEARQQFHLDRILFIPSYSTPNKKINGATAQQRLTMVRLATADNPYFAVSDMEMRRKGNSYTVDTLRFLNQMYGQSYILYFISGTDTIQDLPNWYHPEEILQLCQFIGATRPDGTEAIGPVIAHFGELGRHILKLTVPTMEISSTDLRRRIHSGLSVRYMMPPAVVEYIKKNGVYQCTTKD
ncbi:MAG: nicotinate-nucleotide adenylyltransferase [Megasphaera sp.]|nr:nicotinate-nucleotide adenylyltransferase [Megasphaera sp.]MCH4188242.1 nicotinate-nucleotide adenylyltransferase [Megasphaera sp.]MCH4217302.1 nicotinate-nucleotide adenylyltransferase [Megasphaera sp.]